MRFHLQVLLVTVLTVAVCSPAWAVPATFTQQGRMLNSTGQPLSGMHAMYLVLYDTETGGVGLWSEYHSTYFDNGYYTVNLGSVTPLDNDLFSGASLWLEVTLDGVILEPRQELGSVPWALRATSAENVEGGVVNAASISIDDTPVIDSSGAWVGPTPSVDWTELSGVPTDIGDGDADTLQALSCLNGELASWNGSTWACTADNDTQLSEAEVDAFVANNDYSVGDHTVDTLQTLFCLPFEVASWDGTAWDCATDIDTQLSEAEVDAFVANNNYAVGPHSVNTDVLANMACSPGQGVKWDGTAWDCADETWASNGADLSYSGNVGIGTPSPQASLDVNGGIRIGDDPADCTAGKDGTLRWNGGTVQICNGTEWAPIYTPPPQLANISPNSGFTSGGFTVTLTGTNFLSPMFVSIGGTQATDVTVIDSTTCTATVPVSATLGATNVTVTNPDGGSSTLSGAFTYNPTPYAVVTITENQGVSLNNYPVRVDISGHSTGLSGGFTVTTTDGSAVDYCFEVQSGNQEGECTSSYSDFIWVDLPQIPASGTTDLYLVQGSDTAGTGLDVFEVYEDFEDSSAAPGISSWNYAQFNNGFISLAGSASYYVAVSGSGPAGNIHKRIDYYQGNWQNESDLTLWLDGVDYGGDIDVYCPVQPNGARSWTLITTNQMSYDLCNGLGSNTFSVNPGGSFEYRHRSNDDDAAGMTLNWMSLRPYVDNEPTSTVIQVGS